MELTSTVDGMNARKIIHVDMDAFYASVEQRDKPELRGKPVIVCEMLDNRGVVATASYEARVFGVHSAMPNWKARQLCPQGIYLPVRINDYIAESELINRIFLEYTDLVQPVSLDEAYLDVTENKKNISSARDVAEEIRQRIFSELGLTASAGVSFNMFLAKTASGMKKPNGLTEVTQEQADEFLCKLPIGDFRGVGPVTADKFNKLNVCYGSDLKELSLDKLDKDFGKLGRDLYDLVRGVDNREVNPNIVRQSLGREATLTHDIGYADEIVKTLMELSREVGKCLRQEKLAGRAVTLKVRYSDSRNVITRSKTLDIPTDSPEIILKAAGELLLEKTEVLNKEARKLGVSVSEFPKAD